MGRFLLIFESILNPWKIRLITWRIISIRFLLPEPLLPWLATWVDLALNPAWPLERRRELVKNAAELYRWRGTRRGLAEYLRIYTGTLPQIVEYIPGMILDEKTQLGVNTVMGSSGTGHHFTVVSSLTRKRNSISGLSRTLLKTKNLPIQFMLWKSSEGLSRNKFNHTSYPGFNDCKRTIFINACPSSGVSKSG